MFVQIDDYLSRIYHTLEHVVAPDMTSDFARSQVYAVIALLGSLSKKIEYRQDLIIAEAEAGTSCIRAIAEVLQGAGVPIPQETSTFLESVKQNGHTAAIGYIGKVNEAFRISLDHFYKHRHALQPNVVSATDQKVRSYIHDISLRDVGFMAPTSFDKILKSGK